jgi:hypothetical protein
MGENICTPGKRLISKIHDDVIQLNGKSPKLSLKMGKKMGIVVHAYNYSYLGGRGKIMV